MSYDCALGSAMGIFCLYIIKYNYIIIETVQRWARLSVRAR